MSSSSRSARAVLLAAATFTSWVVLWPVGAAQAAACTIVGTAKADKLIGTSGKDVICGLGGDDTITGNGGDDTIDGGTGNDVVSGGAGNDTLTGGDGNDTMTGGTGNDSMSGGNGTDTVSYSDHTKAVTADLDGVRDDGSSGETDLVTITVENLTGGSGNDTLTGSTGPNVISGGAGNDVIVAGAGNDKVSGGTGNDKITGAAGADNLNGDDGTNICDKDATDTVANCPPDTAAPTPLTYQVSATTIDTSAASKSVTATTRVTDNFSGVASVTAKLVGTAATYTQTATRTSGSEADGTYQAVLTVPQGAPVGTYELFVGATDKAGNVLAPKRSTLTVNQTGDVIAPALLSWTVTPAQIDASAAAKTVTVTARVTDGGSGVGSVIAKLVGPATYAAAATRTDGTAADGNYQAVVTVPAGAAPGTYQVVIVATDAKGNVLTKTTTTSVTNGAGAAGEPDPAPTADTTKPFVTSWQATPTAIDTSAGDEAVTITATATDAGSGVVSLTYQLIGPGGTFTTVVTTRKSGTAANGTYEGAVVLPEATAAGSYQLYIGAADAAGNVAAPKLTNVVVVNEA